MNKIFQSIAISGMLAICSCGGGAKISETQLNAMADSIAAPKIEEINAIATADCEARMATEVKTMVDSMARDAN
jgi:hypothetical protein